MPRNDDAEVERICQAALERSGNERTAFLVDACGGDERLLHEVQSLLALEPVAAGYLEVPAFDVAARAMAADQPQEGARSAALTPGTMLGNYEIVSFLAAGGMGDVYVARDVRLKRNVALKRLPAAFSGDEDRVMRFQREAQVLASLNHPHIAAIYDLVEHQSIHCLVLELVDGDTLAERIAAHRLAFQDALRFAIQIAAALEAAHEKGITHRDLKPANIKIASDGTLKVLDFGLAKVHRADPESELSTVLHTRAGLIVGTAAYMSPEQVRGQAVDARADVWAFGAVLYEMLTGRRAFRGETSVDIASSILNADPDWTRLPDTVVPPIRSLLRRCLQKEHGRRLRNIGDARIEIEEALAAPPDVVVTTAPRGAARRPWMLAVTAAVVIAALGAVIWSRISPGDPPVSTREVRFDIPTPARFDNWVAIAPDGGTLVFGGLAEGKWQLWSRQLDSLTAHAMPGTEGASYPFWSPDSRSIGFFADGKLKRMDIAGGPPTTLANAPEPRGGAWGGDGTIVFTPSLNGTLYRVPAGGGMPEVATRLEDGQVSHRFPSFLPDGRHFLYFTGTTDRPPAVYVASLDGSAQQHVVDSDSLAVYGGTGFLLFARNQTLLAQRFNTQTLAVEDEPFAVAEPIAPGVNGGTSAVSAARNGTLVLRSGVTIARVRLAWFDRKGNQLSDLGDLGLEQFSFPELSSDGTRVSVQGYRTRSGRGADIWLIDSTRGVKFPLTTDASGNQWPIFSPAGDRVVFASSRTGDFDLYQVPSNGTGSARSLLSVAGTTIPSSWSADGHYLLYSQLNLMTGYDLWALPLSADDKPQPVAQRPHEERAGQFSTDMRWIAYESNESGQFEVVVQSFRGSGERQQISVGGGMSARWRADGRELFYVAPDGSVMSAPIQIAQNGTLTSGKPIRLVAPRMMIRPHTGDSRPMYAVTPDGQRFLMVVPGDDAPLPVTVVLNWTPQPLKP